MSGRRLRERIGGEALLGSAVSVAGDESERAARPRIGALPLSLTIATLALTYWSVDIVSPALPAIRSSLGLSATGAGLVFAVFFAGRLVSNLPAALFVDRSGPRRTALVGAAILLFGSLAAATAATETVLLAARGLQGGGVALLATAGLLSVLRALPGGGAAMTAFNLAAGLGGSAGLFSGGWLTAQVGWRAIFWLSAGLAGLLLLGSLVARGVVGTSRATTPVDGGSTVARTTRAALGAALLANLAVYANYSIWVVSLPLYAATRFGAGAAEIGTILLVVNLIHLATAVPVGGMIRRAGAVWSLVLGFGLTAAGLLLTLSIPAAGFLWAPMALYAMGQAAGNSAAGDLILRLGGRGGRAVGMVRLTSDVGLVVGPAAVGLLADAAGVAAPFLTVGSLAGIGAMAAWAAGRRHHRRR